MRSASVSGMQTCALPISSGVYRTLPWSGPELMIEVLPWLGASTCETCTIWLDSLAGPALSLAAASIATEPSSDRKGVVEGEGGESGTSLRVTETVPVCDLCSAQA